MKVEHVLGEGFSAALAPRAVPPTLPQPHQCCRGRSAHVPPWDGDGLLPAGAQPSCLQSPEIPWKRETSSKPVSAQCSPDWSMKVAHPLYNFIWEQDKAGSRCCLCCSSSHRRGSPVVNAQIWVSFSALPHVLRMTFVKLFNCSVLGRFGCKMGECLFSTTPYLACLIPNKFYSSISL